MKNEMLEQIRELEMKANKFDKMVGVTINLSNNLQDLKDNLQELEGIMQGTKPKKKSSKGRMRSRVSLDNRIDSVVDFVNQWGRQVKWKKVVEMLDLPQGGTTNNIINFLKQSKKVKVTRIGRAYYIIPRQENLIQ